MKDKKVKELLYLMKVLYSTERKMGSILPVESIEENSNLPSSTILENLNFLKEKNLVFEIKKGYFILDKDRL